MALALGTYVLALDGSDLPPRDLIGGKAWSVARMGALGLPVPPAIVVTTRACAAFLSHAEFPDGLGDELARGIAWLEERTGRGFGQGASPLGASPLLVSVRSGAAVSMPGMMDTVLNLGITEATERMLAAECGDAGFARDTHRRFRELYAQIVLKAADAPCPQDVIAQLHGAVRAVFESWNSRRARRYRQHQGIADDLGTAVTIQAMVFGNLDARSGTGVLFSRNPLTGDPAPFGEYLPRAQGEDVVSGRFSPQPLATMGDSVPDALAELLRAARLLEDANGDVRTSSSPLSAASCSCCSRARRSARPRRRCGSRSTWCAKAGWTWQRRWRGSAPNRSGCCSARIWRTVPRRRPPCWRKAKAPAPAWASAWW